MPVALDTLISLAKDSYPEVAEYCTNAINTYFENASEEAKSQTIDSLCEGFFFALNALPRVMNNIGEYGRAL